MTVQIASKIGFVQVGDWRLDSSLKSGIRFRLQEMHEKRVIYAFVVGQRVKYIGVCDNTTTTLQDRMSRYQSMTGAGTNRRIAGYIHKLLDSGEAVSIYAWQPSAALEHKGLIVDLVKGLENPLIAGFKPEWNIKG